MPAPAVKSFNKTVGLAEAAVSSGNSGKTFEGVGIKPKLWVKYVAVPDVKKGSNVTISGYRSGKILGCGKMNDGQLRRSDFFRIVGGKTGKVPWQVAVIKRETSGLDVNSLHCGGSILDETHIMTAAHCTRQNGPLILDVMIGKYNFKDRESGATRHKVEKIIDHPKYNHKTMDYDYSILKLNCDDAIDLGSNSPARAICLPKKGDNKRYMKASAYTVSGWGDRSEGGRKSDLLQVLEVPLVKDDACSKQYPGKITSQMICAGFPKGGKDACQADSGGPLTWLDPNTNSRKLVGVVSFGKGCARAGLSGVYSKVERVLSWIKKNTRKCN